MRQYMFRGQRPYWAIDVSDLVEGDADQKGLSDGKNISEPPGAIQELLDEVGGGRGGRLEVWGLTGWYLSLLMETLQIHR